MINVEELIEEQKQQWDSNSLVRIEALVEERLGAEGQKRISPQSWLELICHEVVLREQRGERPTLAEYQARFPNIAEELSIQWDIDRLFSDIDTMSQDPSTIPTRNPDPSDSFLYLESSHGHRYEILAEMGRGANGVVYEAWDPQLKRRLAIKRLRSGLDASSAEIIRIRSEAEAIARIRSPFIVQVFDVGETNGLPFLVMEFCEGGSLAKRLDGKPLRPRIVAEMIASIAKGVAAAHQSRIIHRDLKPANILLESISNWNPKVADFGLAKLLDSDLHATVSGTMLGTPAYMAPEQAFGDAKHVGAASDIYSIGAILYECLTGSPPFRGATPAETLHQVRTQEPVSIRQLRSNVPVDLETIAIKCLNKDPTKRYASALSVADDLHRFLDGKPILARRVSSFEKVNRWRRRNPAVALLLVLTVSLLSMLAVGSTVVAFWLKNERDKVLRAGAERRHELYRAYILEAQSTRRSQQPGQREFGLAAIRSILEAVPTQELSEAQQAELRDEAIASLMRADARSRSPHSAISEIVIGGDVDVDSRLQWVSHIGTDERTQINSLQSGPSPLYLESSTADRPTGSSRAISPDGRWLVELRWWMRNTAEIIEQRKFRVWDFQSKQWVAEQVTDERFQEFVFDSERSICYATGSDDRIHVLSLPSGIEIGKSSARMQEVKAMALSPDGQRLAIAAGSGLSEILDTSTWRTLASFPQITKALSVAWANDTDALHFGCDSGALFQVDVSNYSVTQVDQEVRAPIIALIPSKNGKYLAVKHIDSQFEVLDMFRKQLLFNSSGSFLQFGDDGKSYAFLKNNRVQLAEIDDECVYTEVRAIAEGITFTGDGRWILTGGLNGMRMYSSHDLQLAGDFQTDECGPIILHPNGRELYSFGLYSKIWRWPLESESETGNILVGPASRFRSAGSMNVVGSWPQYQGRHVDFNTDGSLIAIANYRDHRVLIMNPGDRKIVKEFELLNASRVAFSADAHWIASAASIFPKVRVWSLETDRQVLEVEHASMIAFSPDDQYLAVCRSDSCLLYKTANWQLVKSFERKDHATRLAGGTTVAFQPHGNLMAFPLGVTQIQLVEYETGKVVANLNGVGAGEILDLKFSPDGTRLAFYSSEQRLGIVDLSALRSGLLKLKIDASNMPDRVEPLSTGKSSRLQVTIEKGDAFPKPEKWSEFSINRAEIEYAKGSVSDAVDAITHGIERLLPTASEAERATLYTERAKYHEINGAYDAAEADWLTALKIQPDRRDAVLFLARLGVLGPPESTRPTQTIQLAAKLSLDPESAQEATMLTGLVFFRLGRWQECNRKLQEVTELKPMLFAKLFLSASLSRCQLYEEAIKALDDFSRTEYAAEIQMSDLEKRDLERSKNQLMPELGKLKDRKTDVSEPLAH